MKPAELLESIKKRMEKFPVNVIATESGINRQTIYGILEGGKNPTIATLREIDRALSLLERSK